MVGRNRTRVLILQFVDDTIFFLQGSFGTFTNSQDHPSSFWVSVRFENKFREKLHYGLKYK